jgi:acetylornithine deacetylase/succinyl-diaminopimelate desuccinylase-like protein
MKRLLGRSCAALAVFGLTAAPAAPPGPLPPEADRALAREIFKELVEINTTHAFGSTGAAGAIQSNLLAAGFPASDVSLIAPPEHPTKGNLIVRYRGRSHGKPILFLGHLDVVEAKREDWSFDPFKLTERDGWFYGRGTVDMKNGDAALAETLIRLRRERFVGDRDVIVAFTADEEPGGDANGPEFLLRDHRELIDAELAINLDGRGGYYTEGKRLAFELITSEKTYATYTLESTGPGGHGSMPGPDNPIYGLAHALIGIEAYRFPVIVTATTRASFEKLAALDPGPLREDLRAVAAVPPDTAAAERLSRSVPLNAQLRTTCVATLISGGHAENALPQRARATIQCRLMPGENAGRVQQALAGAVNDPKIGISLDSTPIVSPESPPTREILGKVAGVVHSMWPEATVVPSMATWFTDDRETRRAGIPSYDAGGTWIDAPRYRAHGRDECVGVREFDESVEYTYRLVKAMSRRNR